MSRSFIGSLAGVAIGFLVGCVGVGIASGGEEARDTSAIILFVGSFLAGAGAIAGAVIGGVTDVREHIQRKDQVPDREARNQCETLK